MKYILTEKQLNLLIEGLSDKIKSRAPEQEKQKEEYINELLNKKVNNKNLLTLYNILKLKGLKVGLINNEIRLEINKNNTIFIMNNITFSYDEKISLSHFSNGNIKRHYDIYYSEIKTYKDLLEEIGKFLIRENIKLNENLNLKSRAKDNKKQRKEYINQIFKGREISELSSNELLKLHDLFFDITPFFEWIQQKIKNESEIFYFDRNGIIMKFKNVTGLPFLKIKNKGKNDYLILNHNGFKFLNDDNEYYNNINDVLSKIKEKGFNLKENLNLKSRAKDNKKQREKYINQLISKGIENLNSQERLILLEFGKIDILYNKIIDYVKVMLEYWNYEITEKEIHFKLGNTKIVLSINKVLGNFTIKRFITDGKIITSTKSEFATTYKDMISKLMNLLKEGDITND